MFVAVVVMVVVEAYHDEKPKDLFFWFDILTVFWFMLWFFILSQSCNACFQAFGEV